MSCFVQSYRMERLYEKYGVNPKEPDQPEEKENYSNAEV